MRSRSVRSALVIGMLFFTITSWSKQPPQTALATQSTSDPQAVAIVQAAITALGGATAIGQGQTWEFQGQVDGPLDNGSEVETIGLQIPDVTILVNGVSRPTNKYVNSSLFLPALVGMILLQESQDSNYEMQFEGTSTFASKPVNVLKLLVADSRAIAQVWVFDAETGLPVRVFFRSPAQIGQTKSLNTSMDLSDFRNVSGVLYPFKIVTYLVGMLPETLNLNTITTSVPASPTQSAPATGGAQ